MPQSSYKPGSFWRICDRTGFRTRAEDTRKEWNGLIVRGTVFEMRHPQDFVRSGHDDQTVPEARSEPVMQFIGPLTTLIGADEPAGSTVISVASVVRFSVNDVITIILEDGSTFRTSVLTIEDATTITIPTPLPLAANEGALVVNITAYAEPDIG